MEFIDLKQQYQRHCRIMDQAMVQVASSARYINGPQVGQLEETLAEMVGAREAVGVGSGTDALLVALLALGLKPGDEVVCPAFTFIAAAEAVALLGGKPVFAEVEESGAMVTARSVEAALTPRTVGIVPVDLYGQCAPLEEIEKVAQKHSLWLIEDAAQSLGAARNSQMAGSFGDLAITSFYPAKPLGCMGDGGMAFTDDPALAQKMRLLRVHGDSGGYDHVHLGLNARLDTIQAAILLAKLTFFEEEKELRQSRADNYAELLGDIPELEVPRLLKGNTSVWAQYTVRTGQRAGLAAHLRQEGIPVAVHYPRPLHRQPVFRKLGGENGRFEVAEKLSNQVLSLPMHPYLVREDQERVAQAIRGFLER